MPMTRPRGTAAGHREFLEPSARKKDLHMGRYLLLWLIGVPIPILVLIWIFGGLH